MVSTLTVTVLLTLINCGFLGNNVLSVSSMPYNHLQELDKRSFISRRNTKCPQSFTYLSESNKCYRLETDRLEWEVARLRCKGLHPKAHSVVINDAKENRAIATFVAWKYDIVSRHCYTGPRMQIWTAGQRSDPTKKSTFVWKPDNFNWLEMKYTSWNKGQPDFAHNIESCLHMHAFTGEILWNDVPCTTHNVANWLPYDYAFMCVLCEIDMDE